MNALLNFCKAMFQSQKITSQAEEDTLFLEEKVRVVKRFLMALTALAAVAGTVFFSLTNVKLQAFLHLQVLLSLAIAVVVSGPSYILLSKGKPVQASWITIGVLALLLLNRVLTTEMGVRLPSLHLWILAILLGYFVLGVTVGRVITVMACGLSVLLYLAETASLIPGTVGERFPDALSSLFVLLMIFICGYLGAEGMQAHNNLVFSLAEQRNKKLKKALLDIEIVEGTQLRLLNMISTHTREPSDLLIAIAGTIKTEGVESFDSVDHIPIASIKFITQSLLKDFDAAIAAIELDTERVMSGK